MKQSVTQFLVFFKKHKYGRLSLVALFAVLVLAGILYVKSKQQEQPLALSEVAEAISAGRVARIDDYPDSGSLTVYYHDGSEYNTRRDKVSSFLEQMQYLGVSESEMARLQYRIVEPGAFTSEKGTSALMSLLMLGGGLCNHPGHRRWSHSHP